MKLIFTFLAFFLLFMSCDSNDYQVVTLEATYQISNVKDTFTIITDKRIFLDRGDLECWPKEQGYKVLASGVRSYRILHHIPYSVK